MNDLFLTIAVTLITDCEVHAEIYELTIQLLGFYDNKVVP